mmetsp:Transcript_96153/g.161619  ORF Transcript_96153/g.161619 Transcript_96153/m.161619 type:complete len:90 (+) Transcript_96153:346-615(+)
MLAACFAIWYNMWAPPAVGLVVAASASTQFIVATKVSESVADDMNLHGINDMNLHGIVIKVSSAECYDTPINVLFGRFILRVYQRASEF